MKIIAIHQAYRDHMIPGGLVELSDIEMQLLTDLASDQGREVRPGRTFSISKRCKHAMNVAAKIESAKDLPNTLRTLASMLEMSHPAMDEITKEAVDAPPAS